MPAAYIWSNYTAVERKNRQICLMVNVPPPESCSSQMPRLLCASLPAIGISRQENEQRNLCRPDYQEQIHVPHRCLPHMQEMIVNQRIQQAVGHSDPPGRKETPQPCPCRSRKGRFRHHRKDHKKQARRQSAYVIFHPCG